MNDKLLNTQSISSQLDFDEYGGFKLTEVLDASVLEAIGGGADKPKEPETSSSSCVKRSINARLMSVLVAANPLRNRSQIQRLKNRRRNRRMRMATKVRDFTFSKFKLIKTRN
jgi:hypothetical protein